MVCVCVVHEPLCEVCVYTCIYVHIEVRGQHRVFSLVVFPSYLFIIIFNFYFYLLNAEFTDQEEQPADESRDPPLFCLPVLGLQT